MVLAGSEMAAHSERAQSAGELEAQSGCISRGWPAAGDPI